MKRTALLFAVAAGLGLVALAVTLLPMKLAPEPAPAPVSAPPAVVVAEPPPPPVRPATPAPPSPQADGDTLRLTAALSDPYVLQGEQREVFLQVEIDAKRIAASQRSAVNLAIVLDRSGSMAGDKIENCRKAARHLVSQLDERDRLALVTFGSDVTTLIPSMEASAANRQRMLAAIDGIESLGGTYISGGLQAGMAEAIPHRSRYGVTRIVLLSDGQANEGITDPAGLAGVARKMAAQGVTLSSIGVGLDFNENVLESLAEHGGGSYNFLADSEQLPKIFGKELREAVATVAIAPSLSITPVKGAAVAEVYNYLSETLGGATAIRLPDFVSGQTRKIVVRLVVPASQAGVAEVARVGLSYTDVTKGRAPGTAQVAVSASITDDAGLATQNRNKDVAAQAAHAEALQVMRKATNSFSQGNRGQAEQYLREANQELQKARAEFGPSPMLDQALDEARVFESSLSAPAGTAANLQAAKRLHSFSNTAR